MPMAVNKIELRGENEKEQTGPTSKQQQEMNTMDKEKARTHYTVTLHLPPQIKMEMITQHIDKTEIIWKMQMLVCSGDYLNQFLNYSHEQSQEKDRHLYVDFLL